MEMEQVVARINELAAIKKSRPLTPEELEEKARLYEIYLAGFRNSLQSQLSAVRIQEEDGTIHPLKKRTHPLS